MFSRSQPFWSMIFWMALLLSDPRRLDFLPLAMMYCVSMASETRAIMTEASDSTMAWQALSPSS